VPSSAAAEGPGLRLATDHTQPTSFERLVRCIDDLGCATHEILTDRDAVFVTGQTRDSKAIFAPEWVDACRLLGVVQRACRAFRAKTKG